MTYSKLISIHGVPRSGTSWFGQIFNHHPDVLYRYQPVFAYRFRGRLSPASTPAEILAFFDELYTVQDDDYIAGNWHGPEGETLIKTEPPPVMVLKEVRYHYLIDQYLKTLPAMRVIGIVRHPCAVINSWLQIPREFHTDWDPLTEWRGAPSKNQGRAEDYFGFDKWKEVALRFLELRASDPERFHLVHYERLVTSPLEVAQQAFDFAGLEMVDQVRDFLRASQASHTDDPYAVFKSSQVKDRWRTELDPRIAGAIEAELKGTPLEEFLE